MAAPNRTTASDRTFTRPVRRFDSTAISRCHRQHYQQGKRFRVGHNVARPGPGMVKAPPARLPGAPRSTVAGLMPGAQADASGRRKLARGGCRLSCLRLVRRSMRAAWWGLCWWPGEPGSLVGAMFVTSEFVHQERAMTTRTRRPAFHPPRVRPEPRRSAACSAELGVAPWRAAPCWGRAADHYFGAAGRRSSARDVGFAVAGSRAGAAGRGCRVRPGPGEYAGCCHRGCWSWSRGSRARSCIPACFSSRRWWCWPSAA